MWAQNVFICSSALCSVIKFSTIPIFIKLLSTDSREEAGNNLPADRACCLLTASDCPPHTEYACGLDCCEKMDMNNKDAMIIQGHSLSVLLFPRSPRMHQSNGTKIKNQHNSKSNGDARILHSSSRSHPDSQWVRQCNNFKLLLCQNEYLTEERRFEQRRKGDVRFSSESSLLSASYLSLIICSLHSIS